LPVLKFIDAPGSIGFFLLWTVLGVLAMYFWPRTRRLKWLWMATIAAAYVLLGTPVVASTIVWLLPAVPLAQLHDSRRIDTLVVFDGDNRRGRVQVAASTFAADAPSAVVVLGIEEWLVTALVDAGIPAGRVRHDNSTETTRDQIAALKEICARSPEARVAVIASRLQAPRVDALIRTAGLQVVLLSGPVDDEPPVAGPGRFIPDYLALRMSRDALYEHAALAYYRWRGWIA
jgi:uncharacterized SAM-binding protein YcdF (DUF218 family)